MTQQHYDYVIIGSGFGGSVSALRLSEKGYRVLVIEKGRWFSDNTYAKNAWDLKNWLWQPEIGLRGIMKMTVFKHVTVYSGVGVGGGSLTYGATLPTPKTEFFETGSWAKLNNWERALKPHYETALQMLGATKNPNLTDADKVIEELARDLGKEASFDHSRVGIFFSDKQGSNFEPDPYFEGKGPLRKSCTECGSCMTGCRQNAKNTLDKNYLHLAQALGAEIIAEREVEDVISIGKKDGSEGFYVTHKSSKAFGKDRQVIRAGGVIFSGGVLGSVPLLLKLKEQGSLPKLSKKLGSDIRTNNENLSVVTTFDDHRDFAQGVTIGSILHTDENSHVEPINQNAQSGFWRFLIAPQGQGRTALKRLLSLVRNLINDPIRNLKVLFTKNWGQKTLYLLFMQNLDSTLALKRGAFGQLKTALNTGPAPSRDIPHAKDITERVERIVNGKAATATTELVMGTPSTAHILGGAVMGSNEHEGVIDEHCKVFGYENLLVCDGSAISANPGVNPSLSITAVSEWAMSHIPKKQTP